MGPFGTTTVEPTGRNLQDAFTASDDEATESKTVMLRSAA
jgi:hypothetical protein